MSVWKSKVVASAAGWNRQHSDTTFPFNPTVLNMLKHKQHMHYTYCIVLRNDYWWRQIPLKRVCDIFNFQSLLAYIPSMVSVVFLGVMAFFACQTEGTQDSTARFGVFGNGTSSQGLRWALCSKTGRKPLREAPTSARPGRSRRTSTSGALLQ